MGRLSNQLHPSPPRNPGLSDASQINESGALSEFLISPFGLDPVWWTSPERWVRCPQWQNHAVDGLVGDSRMNSSSKAVRLVVDEGKSVTAVARELDLVASACNWVKQAQADRSKGRTGLTTVEREELTRLRRENRILQEEREILKKAAAFFAKHQR